MKTISENFTIDNAYEALKGEPLIILESQLEGHPSSKLSFIAARPRRYIMSYGLSIEIFEDGDQNRFEMNPWDALKQFRSKGKQWLFGYMGYDLKNFSEELESSNIPLTNTPDMYFMEPEIVIKVDSDKAQLISGDVNFESAAKPILPGRIEKELQPLVHKNEYLKNVRQIQKKIHNGDFYELNYTIPLCGTYAGDPYWLYSRMRQVDPVPFGAFISEGKFSVCSASPERFLKKSGTSIRSEPIKGTAERSDDPAIDSLYREELLNEKNRAENLMIVDLVRHDLSRVSKSGTVNVSKLYDIQTFRTVHQLISVIESTVNDHSDSIDILKSCFPMGSMTGAPKIEVMKVIDKLEIYKRGIYSGAIGYITPEDNFDFNVVIRSAIIEDESLFYPVGGAITSDSDPEAEWNECMVKSKNLTDIFETELNL